MNTRVAAFDSDLVADTRPDTKTDDTAKSTSRFSVEGIMQSLRSVATVSEALRILGAAVILASMSVFLMQGWSAGNDINRYLLLLMQTGLLAVAGFAMSHLVKEAKGARLFFGLALVSIPANFAILGALLYSVFQWDGGLVNYPGYADWRIEDVASIGMTMSAALLVLVPVSLFCFAIMARHSAKMLSLHFLILNALLLLPIRTSMAAGSVALLGIVYALVVTGKLLRENAALKTGEGKFALAALYIPLGIILFRSTYFYQVDSLMVAMIGMALFLAGRQASQFPDRSPRMAFALEILSWPLALIVAAAFSVAFDNAMSLGQIALVFSAVFAALAFDIMRRTKSPALARSIGTSIAFAIAASLSFATAVVPSAGNALLAICAGALLLLWGASARRALIILAGLFTVGTGALFGFEEILQLVISSSWIDLAVFGVGAIVLGSILDRHGVAIKLRVTSWYNDATREKTDAAIEQRLAATETD